MFQRDNFEISFENLRLDEDCTDASLGTQPRSVLANISNEAQSLTESNSLEANKAPTKPIRGSVSFLDLMKRHKENFIIISQKDKSAYLQLTLSDIIGFFSIPVCTREDGRTKCKYNCDCAKSLDIGMQIYEKGGVQNFHQFGNFVIGCVIEQQTDPLTRVTIEFEKSSMKHIKRIYCPCKFMYCPHAFAVLYFRLKIQSFYAIKLPQQLFDGSLEQSELMKFFGYLVEEARSLPLMCDYQTKEWSLEHFKQYADVNSSMMYAYCHKSLLPIPFNIIEEQSRARKWISDLHTKRSQLNNNSATNSSTVNGSAGSSQFLATSMKHNHANANGVLMNSTSDYVNSYAKMKHHSQQHQQQQQEHLLLMNQQQHHNSHKPNHNMYKNQHNHHHINGHLNHHHHQQNGAGAHNPGGYMYKHHNPSAKNRHNSFKQQQQQQQHHQ